MMGPLFEARAAARGSSLSITVLIAERRRAVLSKRAAVCPFLPAHMTLAAADCRAAPPGCPVTLDEVRAENQFQMVEGEVRRAARVAEDRSRGSGGVLFHVPRFLGTQTPVIFAGVADGNLEP